MSTWSFYNIKTGEIISKRYTGSRDGLAANTPEGTDPIEGAWDNLSYRVDPSSRVVIDWRPSAPDDDYEWDNTVRRWVQKIEVVEAQVSRARIIQEILNLETKQARALREAALGREGAQQRLADIDNQINTLRAELNG